MHPDFLTGFDTKIENANMVIFEQDLVSVRDLHQVLRPDGGTHGKR
jgi:hypothetical protein